MMQFFMKRQILRVPRLRICRKVIQFLRKFLQFNNFRIRGRLGKELGFAHRRREKLGRLTRTA